jgi:hypothetical protein
MSTSSLTASRAFREGLNHLARSNTKQAISCLQSALIADPSLTEAYSKLAAIESTEKHPVTSLKYSIKTLQHISAHYGAHATTGLSLLSMTKSVNSIRYQDALKSLTESLELNPWSGWLATKLILLKTSSQRKIEVVPTAGAAAGAAAAGGASGIKRKSNHVLKIISVSESEGEVTSTVPSGNETGIGGVEGGKVMKNSGTKKGTLIEFDLLGVGEEEGERKKESDGSVEGEGGEGKIDQPDESEKKKDE